MDSPPPTLPTPPPSKCAALLGAMFRAYHTELAALNKKVQEEQKARKQAQAALAAANIEKEEALWKLAEAQGWSNFASTPSER